MIAAIRVTSNRLAELSASLHALGEEALDAGVVTLMEVADPLTPVDTGALRSNISISSAPMERTVTWNQDYAIYVHEGTYKMAARPFARIGADAAIGVIDAKLAGWGG